MIRVRIAVWLTIAVAVWASVTLARSAHPGPANLRRRLGARLARVALAAFVLLVGTSTTRAAPCAPVASAVGVAAAAPDVPAPGSAEAIPAPLRKRALALREALALARRALHLAQGVRASRVIYRSQWQIGRLQRRRSEALRARESLDAAFEEVLALRRDLAFGDPGAAAVEQTIRVGGEEPLQLCVVEDAIALDPEPQHAHALAAGKRSGFGRKLQRRQLDDRSFGRRQGFRELGALALGREDVQLRGRGPRRDQHQPCRDRRSTPHELRAILTQPQPASAATMRSGWMARRPRPPPG
ncbi:MAG: hypothetical protein JRG92_09180 [Deltaproteobacteria bacterium]|nr:hypothetical protein [Deltaproteobacteria bacterium]